MIAAIVGLAADAFEGRRYPGKQRCAAFARMAIQSIEFVRPRPGEALREPDLIFGKNVHRKMRARRERGETLAFATDRPQHQRRIQRYRGKRIRRQAEALAVRGGGNHRNPGRKFGKAAAKAIDCQPWISAFNRRFHRRPPFGRFSNTARIDLFAIQTLLTRI
jgi:hypothetical protein